MSTNTDSLTDSTISDLTDLIEEQAALIDDQRETIEEQAALIEDQQQQNTQLVERIDEFETHVESHKTRLEQLERAVDIKHEKHLSWLDTVIVGDETGYLTDAQEEFLEEHDSLIDCLQALTATDSPTPTHESTTHETTRLRRIVESVADTVGLDTDDALGGADEDTLTRLMKYGPSDITDRVYAVHNRARDLLSHIGEWGRTTNDVYGKRITITAPVVKEKLSLKRGEQLTSTEVRRIFEKLEALAADSPREVRADTGGRSQNRLLIRLPE